MTSVGAFRLRTIDTTADGRQIVRDRDVAATTLSVGRSAENDIHLPDLAVDPEHATLELQGTRVVATAKGTLGFGVDGVVSQSASIDPSRGAELRFGSYNLTISRDADGTPLITIAQVASQDAGEATDEKHRFSLATAIPGKRTAAWVLGLLVLVAFLAFPVVSNLWHQANPAAKVHGDKSWSAGPLSLAHHSLEGSCESCHVKPFEAVRDTACVSCHKDVHDHAAPARLALARGGGPWGQRMLWAVAHAFNKPGPGACVDCHTEHEGPTRMALPAQQFCSDCHGALKDKLPDTRLGNASDFGKMHPQFTPAIVTDPVTGRTTPVSLDAHPRENSGLAFPHSVHLDPLGGVARMAASIGREKGYGRAGLQCENCHHATEDGVRFQKINMERDCEACHSLAYDKVGGTVRRLRHGDVDQMIADLSAAGPNAPIAADRHRPGQFAPGGNYHINFTPPRYTSATFQQALSKDGVCGECHTPVMRNGKPGVMPVRLVSRYMVDGWFNHKAHTQEKCTSCHAAEKSASSTDLLLPNVQSCRTCHQGEDSHQAKVPSGCAMCHGYHPTQNAPRGAKDDRT
ncbi:cytochrome c3 family protein [Novosphingobium sp. G106]|uniref:cytochrome c3 family protein n=1 Tax=Novosphingobium sp. G106 TaxID=2849500 RepID=UPI001C2D31FF|nr:cytochrome c3 family protein [Novosphingobium sp. G106]MBV1690163.1 cytochrome c3 family protein [Novosphingobium sp. G106]